MGCDTSKTTVVHPLRSNELEGDEDETGSKHGGRGDSAVSKGTTDSGVVMENREISMLPGTMPRKLPPLTGSPGLPQQDGLAVERPKSSEILEQLLNQGIIPEGQAREGGSGAGEAYNIMLDDREVPRRRPPARLESLKTRKEQSPTSIEAIDQKMKLVEERRKLREDELKARLRAKSARARGPAPISASPEEVDTLTPVEHLQKPLTSNQEDPLDPPLHTQVREATRGLAEGGEWVREAGGDGREGGGGGGEDRGEGRDGGGELQREVTKVEELKAGQLLIASGELESDSTFQFGEDNEEIF